MVVCIFLFNKAILRFYLFLTGFGFSALPFFLLSLFVYRFQKLLISKNFMGMINSFEVINHKH